MLDQRVRAEPDRQTHFAESKKQSDQQRLLTKNGQKILRGATSPFRRRGFNIAGANAHLALAVLTPMLLDLYTDCPKFHRNRISPYDTIVCI